MHNLKGVDVVFGDGLTVVTGVSGSGKTSLVFDTLYHEARRRFLDVFSTGTRAARLAPANVESVIGLGPAVAVGQNLLNRNPRSTLATASGLHPFLRLLYARFGTRYCPRCGTELTVLTEDEIVEELLSLAKKEPITVYAPLVPNAKGSHRTLLKLLAVQFGPENLLVDGKPWKKQKLKPDEPHNIEVKIAKFTKKSSALNVRDAIQTAVALGANAVTARTKDDEVTVSQVAACIECGTQFGDLEPVHFHRLCPYCQGKGCKNCAYTGLHPKAASVRWQGVRLPELLELSVDEAQALFTKAELPSTADRLKTEIERRLESLVTVGLGYVQLNRSSPTLSRGEAQRVRLAVSLTSRLEDVIHVLDEPTVGQHMEDVDQLIAVLQRLVDEGHTVIVIEHHPHLLTACDWVIELGPGGGPEGGKVIASGTPETLAQGDTPTAPYLRQVLEGKL